MGLFRRDPAPRIDPSFGDERYTWLAGMAQTGNWPAARDFLLRLNDPRDVAFYLDAIAGVDGSERWLSEVVNYEPSPLALCAYGVRLVEWAWSEVGLGIASQVNDQQRARYRERLRLAEQVLTDAIRKDPEYVPAWAELITTSRGLNLGVDETMRRFTQVVARSPEHMGAHHSALQDMCEKWHGSHEMMFNFARAAMHNGRPGSQLGELVVQAHVEYWGALGPDGTGYFERPEVVQELLYAASSSIWHPQYQRRPDWPKPFNYFALAFSLADKPIYASRIFKEIGDRMTQAPWENLVSGDPVGRFIQFRRDMRV